MDTNPQKRTKRGRRTRVFGAVIAILALCAVSIGAQSTTPPVSDPMLTTQAKIAVLTSVGMNGLDVNVDTVDGVVTLHGTVASEEDKANAEKAAAEIEGVTKVENILQVVAVEKQAEVAAKDAEIAEKAGQRIVSRGVYVQSVNDGTVLLAGEVDTHKEHLHAIESIRRVGGVKAVESEVRISAEGSQPSAPPASPESVADPMDQASNNAARMASDAAESTRSTAADVADSAERLAGQVGSAVSDSTITSAVKARLAADDVAPAMTIDVDTNDGVVTLKGAAASEEQKEAAENEAQKVFGVEEVRNELDVVAESPTS